MQSSGPVRGRSALPGVLAVALLLLSVAPALAQRGAIRGKITDPDGNPVPGVQVSIDLLEGGGRPLRTETNDKGEFTRAGVPVQMYRVSFELEGWEPLQAIVTVSSGGQSFINETMHPLPEGVLSQAQADRFNAASSVAQDAFMDGDYETAVAETLKLIELTPNVGNLYFNLAAAYEELQDYTAAIEAYERAYELDDSLLQAIMAVGDLHGRQKQWDQALAALDRATELVEGNAVSLFNYAVYATNAGKIELADEYYEKAAAADPEFAPAYLQIGMAKARQEDREGAIAAFERFLEIDPDNPQAAMVHEILDQLRNPGS